MKRIHKISHLLAIILGVALLSCSKDLDEQDLAVLNGECRVAFELQGMPLSSALTRTSGDAIRNIGSLYILFYKPENKSGDSYKLAYAFTTDAACKNSVFESGLRITSTTDSDRIPDGEFDPNDGEWKGVSESTTKRVTTSEIQIERGDYAVYVVANVDEFSSASFSRDTIATPELLRNYKLTWNKTSVKDNDAMFGFFTEESTDGYDVINTEAPIIHFTANTKTLHAWVKRATSKVTVAFDGSRLRDGVRIYIKDIAIRDIPTNCKLGENNTPVSKKELTDGEQIVYTTTAGVTNATRISSREPYFPGFTGLADNEADVEAWKINAHSETANALYFFENRQGKSSGAIDGNGSWKQQTDINGNNIPDDRDSEIHSDIDPNKGIQKDTKEFGTYIEVTAYYQNDNFGAKTEGIIIYRFMLGKNTTDDFNADRNNHYKLTMCFKNNANEVDWHIDYTDKEDVYIPDTIYMSYEYNTPSMLPIRIVGNQFTSLSVQITESNWYPDDSSIPYYKANTTQPDDLSTGFFSLSYDENPRIGGTGEVPASTVTDYWLQQPSYDPNGENTTTNKNEVRQYIRNGKVVKWSDLEPHGYAIGTRVASDGRTTVFEANIPLFTRPLIIYKWTSWTGANPYYSAPRKGKILVSGILSGKPYTHTINVIQVPRVENPSGIYRRHDNTAPFDVTLMARKGEGGTHTTPISYAPFDSKGLWRAIIYRSTSGGGNNVGVWFTLTAGSQRAKALGDCIQGDINTPIKFTFKPNEAIDQNKVRCGIIKVEYNDYTCTHYIFVRQGYAPMQLEAGRVYWHTFNLYSGSAETSHPCDAGSLFLRGLWAPAILDSNTAGYGVTVNSLSALTDVDGTTQGSVSIPINNSGAYKRKDFPTTNRTFSKNDATYNPWNSGRVPTLAEWATLKNDVANALVDKSFGVLYGDGATTTQTVADNVNGCLHANVNAKGEAQKGMRGCFVYNSSDGRNIFFPIGASGYGRRKVGRGSLTGTSGTSGGGVLQYSFSDTYFAYVLNNARRPLLYNLNTNEGAIYWGQAEISNQTLTGQSSSNGWDINYKTYDFDYMEAASASASTNRHSACYIRLVQTDAPK